MSMKKKKTRRTADKSRAEKQARNKDPLEDVRFAVEQEGFDYAFRCYSDFDEIDDPKFHELREAYRSAADALEKHVYGRRQS